jgi:hypothetical protein
VLLRTGRLLRARRHFTKPVVACVVGRWKSKLTRAVGHAGAMAAARTTRSPRTWFMDKFGVDAIFTPEKPVFSAKGALVTNIAHIPVALTRGDARERAMPDFAPRATWRSSPGSARTKHFQLPAELKLPVVEALSPYNEQVALLNKQIGGLVPRQSDEGLRRARRRWTRRRRSAACTAPRAQCGHPCAGVDVALALVQTPAVRTTASLIAPAVAAYINLYGRPEPGGSASQPRAGNAPNSVLAAAAAIVGPKRQLAAREALKFMIERFHAAELGTEFGACLSESFDISKVDATGQPGLTSDSRDARAHALIEGVAARGGRSVFLRWLKSLSGHPTEAAALARSLPRWPGDRFRANASRA